jgi:hypothetical protein
MQLTALMLCINCGIYSATSGVASVVPDLGLPNIQMQKTGAEA